MVELGRSDEKGLSVWRESVVGFCVLVLVQPISQSILQCPKTPEYLASDRNPSNLGRQKLCQVSTVLLRLSDRYQYLLDPKSHVIRSRDVA